MNRLGLAALAVLLATPLRATSFPDAAAAGFSRHSTEDGMSCNVVHSLRRDPRGFLWAATSYGLCRYDGCGFRNWYREELDIPTNFITTLEMADDGSLWVGTDGGVTVYDPHAGRFTNLNTLAGTEIRTRVPAIQKDAQGNLWVAVNRGGLCRVDPRTFQVRTFLVGDDGPSLSANIASMYIDVASNRVFLGAYLDNLYVADTTLTSLRPFTLADGREPFRGMSVKRIIKNGSNSYYVSYAENGVCEINPATGSIRMLPVSDDRRDIFKDLCLVDRRHLWIATNNGIITYDSETGRTDRLTYVFDDPNSLPDNSVLCISGDLAHGVAVGTYGRGIGILRVNADGIIRRIRRSGGETLSGVRVRNFVERPDGQVWVGTEQQGLYVYHPDTDQLHKYPSAALPDNITSLMLDGDHLWISSRQGIYRLDVTDGAVRVYPDYHADIYKFFRTSWGDLLVGTTLGVLRYDRERDAFSSIGTFDGLFVEDILEDDNATLCLATYADGLVLSTSDYATMTKYRADGAPGSIPGNKVLCLHVDVHGSVWAGVHGHGVCRLEKDGTFRVFDREHTGLPNNIIYSIREDREGHLWIATDQGLCVLEPDGRMRTYTESDGLINNDFTYNAALRLSDGTLLFGSRDGFVRLSPGEMPEEAGAPSILVSDLFLSGGRVHPGEHSPLQAAMGETTDLTLSWRDNSPTFRVSVLSDDLSRTREPVWWRLDGYGTDWKPLGADGLIPLMKLPAGKYVLRIKDLPVNGADGIRIAVQPVAWKSWPARVLAILAALTVLWGVFCWARRRAHAHQVAFAQQKDIDLYHEKIAFLGGIAHEIKTPLTLIRTPLENALHHPDIPAEIREDLDLVDSNAQYLSKVVGELLDFTKVEQHGYRLVSRRLDLVSLVESAVGNFSGAARAKGLSLTFSSAEETVWMSGDPLCVSKILNNLLSNALKYAEHFIEVLLSVEEDGIRVRVRNDGEVVPPAERESIFHPFVQYRDSRNIYTSGFGIGLYLARTLTEMQGGSLVMADEEDVDEFILTFPAAEVAALVEEEEIEEGPEEADGRPCVLVVEDQAQLRKYLADKLGRRYEVISAPDGKEALDLVASGRRRVDVVVTDLSMPRLDGFGLCRALKADLATSHVPVIVLSAHNTDATKVEAVQAGAALYIEKPFSLDYLVSCIDRMVTERKEMARRYVYGGEPSGEEEARLSRRDREFIDTLEVFVQANLADPELSVDAMVEAMSTSRSTLTRKVKELLDMTPSDYLLTKRLIRAGELIRSGEYVVRDVCYATGFSTPSFFSKVFRGYYGVTPSEYAKNIMKSNEL